VPDRPDRDATALGRPQGVGDLERPDGRNDCILADETIQGRVRDGRDFVGEAPCELLISLPIEIEAINLDLALGEVSDLARNLNLTAYDAAYLALAARRGLVLATIDESLKRAL